MPRQSAHSALTWRHMARVFTGGVRAFLPRSGGVATLLLVLTACTSPTVSKDYSMFDGPPDGQVHPGLYLQGWRDGCETGAASSADNIYNYRRLFKQNWQLAQNDVYHQGWRDAYDYCRKRILYGQQG